LIVWGATRGSVGITPDRYSLPRDTPARLPVQARIGASSDTLDVWAVQVNVIVGGLSEAEEDLDENAVSVYVNSDDDNENGIADMNESNDALALGVRDEDELTQVSFDLQPSGLPVGALSLTLPDGNHFAACAYDNKAGGRLVSPSWNLAADSAPSQVYLEGISQCGPASLSLQYRLGGTLIAADGAKVKCEALPAFGSPFAAGAYLRIYAAQQRRSSYVVTSQASGMSEQSPAGGVSIRSQYSPHSGGAIGGEALIGLVLSLPAQTGVVAEAAFFRVEDQYDPEHIYGDAPCDILLSTDWYYYDSSLSPDEWEPFFLGDYYGGPPTLGRFLDHDVRVVKPISWDTRITPTLTGYVPPMGTNGTHVIRMSGRASPHIAHAPGIPLTTLPLWIQLPSGHEVIAIGPKPTTVNVSNLTIKDVRAEKSLKPEDYFKYDPTPGSQYNRPVIHCTVEDNGDPHEYDVYMVVRPTSAYG
jgi:hypothetical protein